MKAWNKREVGNLEENVKHVEKEIDMVQGIFMTDPHNVFLQTKIFFFFFLSQKLNQVMKLEEIKWVQKARQAWTQFGDRNNRYFQSLALNRRRKCRI